MLPDIPEHAPRLAANIGWLAQITIAERAGIVDNRPDTHLLVSFADVAKVDPDYPRTSFRRDVQGCERVSRGVYSVALSASQASGATAGRGECLQDLAAQNIEAGGVKRRRVSGPVDTSGARDCHGQPVWQWQTFPREAARRIAGETGQTLTITDGWRKSHIVPGRPWTNVTELADVFETTCARVRSTLDNAMCPTDLRAIPTWWVASRRDVSASLAGLVKKGDSGVTIPAAKGECLAQIGAQGIRGARSFSSQESEIADGI